MNNDWQNREFNLILLALVAGVAAAFIAVRFLRLNFMLGIVVFLIVFFLIFDKTSAQNKSLVKVYQASLNDSILVVQNVLAEKGIPYRKSGADRFLLERDGVEISLKHVQRRYGGEPRTVLKLIPHNAESWPLIFSLRDKIDDAFRPRGLHS